MLTNSWVSVLVCLTAGCVMLTHGLEQTLPYPCQVFGCKDAGSTCDDVTGKCACKVSLSNPDYQCTENNGAANPCTGCIQANTMDNANDICTANNQCHCKEGWTGATCNTRRNDLVCSTADAIQMDFTFYQYINGNNFIGEIYVSATNDFSEGAITALDDNCKFDFSSSITNTWTATVGVGRSCTQITQSTHERHVFVYIQYLNGVKSTFDTILRLACFTSADAGVDSSTHVVNAPNTADIVPLPSTKAAVAGSNNLAMSLKTESTPGTFADIGGAMEVGDPISLVIERDATFGFQVVSCTAQNYVIGQELPSELKTLNLIDNWCVPVEAAVVYRGPVVISDTAPSDSDQHGASANDKLYVRLDLKAFYFQGPSNILSLSCLICQDASHCDNPTHNCDNTLLAADGQNTMSGFRRRRDTNTLATSTVGMSVYINVTEKVDSIKVTVNDEDESAKTRDCYKSTSVLLPIILLAALLLVTMVMTFFFCMKVTHSEEQQKLGHENMSYKP